MLTNTTPQGTVAMQLRCGATFYNHVIANFPKCPSEGFFKIGQCLAKIWTKV